MTTFEQYKQGFDQGVADSKLLNNECGENGYTYDEYLRIQSMFQDADFAVRIGSADSETKGYSDGFDIQSMRRARDNNNYIDHEGRKMKPLLSDLFFEFADRLEVADDIRFIKEQHPDIKFDQSVKIQI